MKSLFKGLCSIALTDLKMSLGAFCLYLKPITTFKIVKDKDK